MYIEKITDFVLKHKAFTLPFSIVKPTGRRWLCCFAGCGTAGKVVLPACACPHADRRCAQASLYGFKNRLKAIVTDGLASYASLLPDLPHLLCHFHHQQGVTP